METPKLEYIQSKDNRTLKRAISLQNRKYRDQYNEYLVEGGRAVKDLAQKSAISTLLIKESKLSGPDAQSLINAYHTDISIFVVQDPLFQKLENTVHTQGIMGIARKPIYHLDNANVSDGLYLAIDGVQDPGNLGTIIRTAVASGVKGVFLLKGTVDPYNDKCVRSTMSALHSVPIYENIRLSEFYDFVKDNDIETYATALEESAPYGDVSYHKRTMIIVGNEGNGVSQELLQMSDHRISIPMYGDIESLNVSIATALCLFKVQEQFTKEK